jgi:hypothetical protein
VMQREASRVPSARIARRSGREGREAGARVAGILFEGKSLFLPIHPGRSVDRKENHRVRGVALAVHGGLCVRVYVWVQQGRNRG